MPRRKTDVYKRGHLPQSDRSRPPQQVIARELSRLQHDADSDLTRHINARHPQPPRP